MSRDDAATVLDLVRAAQSARQFTRDMNKAAFLDDPKTQSAVLHQLLILGEAAKRLSAPFRSQHPEVPWKTIAGMRDKLIHAYDEADLEEVWNTISTDLPQLLARLEPVLPQRPTS